jgi:hypothetical protein
MCGNRRQGNSVKELHHNVLGNSSVTHLPTIQYEEYVSHVHSSINIYYRCELNISLPKFSIVGKQSFTFNILLLNYLITISMMSTSA